MLSYFKSLAFQQGRFTVLKKWCPAFAILAILAAVAFALRAVLARGGAAHLSLAHIMVIQSGLSVPLMIAMARYRKTRLTFGLQHAPLYATRTVVSIAYGLTLLYSMKLMPAALASALSYTAPLFTAALAPLVLREKTTFGITLATAIGFLGIGITALPYLEQTAWLALLVGLVCGLSGAGLQISIRMLATRAEPAVRGVFWMHVISFWLGLAACVVEDGFVFSKTELIVSASIAVVALAGQLLNAAAYSHGRALPVNALSFVTLPLTVLLAAWLLGEHVESMTVTGMAITLVACLAVVLLEQRLTRPARVGQILRPEPNTLPATDGAAPNPAQVWP